MDLVKKASRRTSQKTKERKKAKERREKRESVYRYPRDASPIAHACCWGMAMGGRGGTLDEDNLKNEKAKGKEGKGKQTAAP